MLNKLSEVGRYATLLVAIMTAGSASAGVAEWKSFDQKVSEADAIVRGELISSESRRDANGRWIRTWSTFRVDEVLKGSGNAQAITIVTPGGEVDGIHQQSIGSPSFSTGQEQIIFLDNTTEGLVPLYLEQGVYDVTRDDGDRLLVRPSPSNLILYDDQTGNVVPAEATRTIEDFRGQIRERIEPRQLSRSSAIDGDPSQKEGILDFLSENAILLVLLSLGLLIAFITWMRKP